MDANAYNYNPLVNVNDSASCLYSAGCITGDGVPYWLNDPCYSWVIDVDDYCCDNEWDNICQLTYDYCNSNWTGIQPLPRLGLKDIFIYPNPTKDIFYISKHVYVEVYDKIGRLVISDNSNVVNLSDYGNGIYNIIIIFEGEVNNFKIIKN